MDHLWDVFESSVHMNLTLSKVDKFIYLRSLLESTAVDAISGLSLSSANYDEAVTILQKRFGNKKLIIAKHMDALCNLEAVRSVNNLKSLRHLFDTVEAHVRGLRALGVPSTSYGELLTSVLMNKLPQELRLLIGRKLGEDDWMLDAIMVIFETEVTVRESTATAVSHHITPKPTKPSASNRTCPTLNSFMTTNQVSCAYCSQSHPSASCRLISTVEDRKQALMKSGCCFNCLRRGHIGRDCRSSTKCNTCSGRHHISICVRSTCKTITPPTTTQTTSTPTPNASSTTIAYTCVDTQTPVLLQTARATIGNPSTDQSSEVRLILDCGSQRTYITKQVQETLSLKALRTETVMINTFGANQRSRGEVLYLSALVVPVVCDPVCCQPISLTQSSYDYLLELDLANSSLSGNKLDIYILIGSDYYWMLVTGRVLRDKDGPTAIHSRLGWILSGPTDVSSQSDTFVNLISSHSLLADSSLELEPQDDLDSALRKFWTLESLGISSDEPSVYDVFKQHITFKDHRYVVNLPWKETHPHLPTNLDLCRRRLDGLLHRLKQEPDLHGDYHRIIQDQVKRGLWNWHRPLTMIRNTICLIIPLSDETKLPQG